MRTFTDDLNAYCRDAWNSESSTVAGFDFKDDHDNSLPDRGVLTTDLLTRDGPEPVYDWMKHGRIEA